MKINIEENLEDNLQWLQDYRDQLKQVSTFDEIKYFPKVVDYLLQEGLFQSLLGH